MTLTEKLIEIWNARPPRVEPQEDSHLLYIFTGLLPALRDAMPKIVELMQAANVFPNIDLPPAPAPAPNSHSQDPNLSTVGNGEASGPVTDTGGKPASLPASVGETENGVSGKRPLAEKRAKATKTKKSAAAPHVAAQEIGESVIA